MLERPLNDDSIDGILVAHRLFCEQQTLKVDGLDLDAIEVDRL